MDNTILENVLLFYFFYSSPVRFDMIFKPEPVDCAAGN